MRKITKAEIVVVLLVFSIPAIAWITSEIRWARMNNPAGRFGSVEEYVQHGRLPERVTKTMKEGRSYFIAFSPMNHGLAVPSGPAAYVFDSNGQLVDWSPDTGDDPDFIKRWPHDKQRPSSLRQMRAR